jgi:hypothetical protein
LSGHVLFIEDFLASVRQSTTCTIWKGGNSRFAMGSGARDPTTSTARCIEAPSPRIIAGGRPERGSISGAKKWRPLLREPGSFARPTAATTECSLLP